MKQHLVSHQILGAKLPSNKQAKQTINAVSIFWQQARIPVRESHECSRKLLKMHDEWNIIKKKKPKEMTAATKECSCPCKHSIATEHSLA